MPGEYTIRVQESLAPKLKVLWSHYSGALARSKRAERNTMGKKI